jgi:hypothetical protein
MFELPDPTTCTLTTITNRVEKHGDDDKPAVSFGLKFEAANTILDLISDTLLDAIYMPVPGQPELEGVEQAKPNLRCKDIEQHNVAGRYEGWTLTVDHGIDEHKPITFGGCKVDKFRVAAKEGGTVELSLRVGTSDIDAEGLGVVGMKLAQQISVTIRKPEKADEKPSTDGKPTLPLDGAKDGGPWPLGDKGEANKPAMTPEDALAETQP